MKPKAVNKKKESAYSFDTQMTLSFFRMNRDKFNPLKVIKKPEEQPNPKLEENSTLKGILIVNSFWLNCC